MALQQLLYLGLVAYGLGCFAILVNFGRSGNPWMAALAIWLASPIALYGLRFTLESDYQTRVFSLDLPNWAFVFGDTLVLPIVAFVAALGWRRLSKGADVWYNSPNWLPFCMLVGVLAGIAFHYSDTQAYAEAGAQLAMQSPSKLAHDFVAYPVIMGGLLYLGVPVLMAKHLKTHWLVIILCVVIWCILAYMGTVAGLDPKLLHPEWDPVLFEVIRS